MKTISSLTQNGKVIVEQVISISAMFGIIPAKKAISKTEAKEIIKKQILKKHNRH